MNKSVKKEWLTKLTNRKYLQARGALKKDKHHYCCLGVLNTCVPADKRTPLISKDGFRAAVLSTKTLRAAGLHHSVQLTLIEYNDALDYSFKEIAQHIKERL